MAKLRKVNKLLFIRFVLSVRSFSVSHLQEMQAPICPLHMSSSSESAKACRRVRKPLTYYTESTNPSSTVQTFTTKLDED